MRVSHRRIRLGALLGATILTIAPSAGAAEADGDAGMQPLAGACGALASDNAQSLLARAGLAIGPETCRSEAAALRARAQTAAQNALATVGVEVVGMDEGGLTARVSAVGLGADLDVVPRDGAWTVAGARLTDRTLDLPGVDDARVREVQDRLMRSGEAIASADGQTVCSGLARALRTVPVSGLSQLTGPDCRAAVDEARARAVEAGRSALESIEVRDVRLDGERLSATVSALGRTGNVVVEQTADGWRIADATLTDR